MAYRFFLILILSLPLISLASPGELDRLGHDDLAFRVSLLEQQPFGSQGEIKAKLLKVEKKSYLDVTGLDLRSDEYRIFHFEIPVWNKIQNKMLPFQFKIYKKTVMPWYLEGLKSNVVLIHTTIEGESLLERRLAKAVALEGGTGIIVNVFDFDYARGAQGLPDLNERTLFGVQQIRSLLDYLEKRPRLDQDLPQFPAQGFNADHVYQVASSNGTVTALLLAAVEPRIYSQHLVVGIGNVPAVMATTANEKLKKFRDEQMSFWKLPDIQTFAQLIRQHLQVDPVDVVKLVLKNSFTKLWTHDADTTVLSEYQKELDRAFQEALLEERKQVKEDKKLSSKARQEILTALDSTYSHYHTEEGFNHVMRIVLTHFTSPNLKGLLKRVGSTSNVWRDPPPLADVLIQARGGLAAQLSKAGLFRGHYASLMVISQALNDAYVERMEKEFLADKTFDLNVHNKRLKDYELFHQQVGAIVFDDKKSFESRAQVLTDLGYSYGLGFKSPSCKSLL